MKLLLSTALHLICILAYLGAVCAVGRVRGARLQARGALGGSQFRAERDPGVRAAILVVGLLLGAVVYVVSRAFGVGF